VEDWVYWLRVAWSELLHDVRKWTEYTFWWNKDQRDYYWWKIALDITVIGELIWQHAIDSALAVVTTVEEWVTGIVGIIEEGASTIVDRIASLWHSVGSVWATFGANLLDEYLTVEDWVERAFDASWKWASQHWKDAVADIDFFYNWVIDWGSAAATWIVDNGTKVWNWIRDNSAAVWDWIRDNSGTVWDWIRDKSGTVYDWIIGTGANVESWYDEQYIWLSDLYTNKRAELADFLDDPGRYIADWVVDSFEYVISECVWRFW